MPKRTVVGISCALIVGAIAERADAQQMPTTSSPQVSLAPQITPLPVAPGPPPQWSPRDFITSPTTTIAPEILGIGAAGVTDVTRVNIGAYTPPTHFNLGDVLGPQVGPTSKVHDVQPLNRTWHTERLIGSDAGARTVLVRPLGIALSFRQAEVEAAAARSDVRVYGAPYPSLVSSSSSSMVDANSRLLVERFQPMITFLGPADIHF